MTHKEDEMSEVLQHFADMKREKEKVKRESLDTIHEQDILIGKYQKALEDAFFDIFIVFLRYSLFEHRSRCQYCPFESDCDKKDKTASDCKIKFIKRWKEEAGIE